MEGHVTGIPETVPAGSTLVALPYVSKVGFTGPTTGSLLFNAIYGGFPRCGFQFYGDNSVVGARNAAAQDAIRHGFEWVFFVDSDMDFPVGTLKLLQGLNADIACVDMWARNWPSFRTVLHYGKDDKGKKQLVPFEGRGEELGVQDIDCCGMACTLVRTELFKKFAKKKWMPFTMGVHGEDAAFCILARQKFKATMKCDFRVVAGHWGVTRNTGQDYTRDARNQPGALADPAYLARMGARNIPSATDVPPAPEPERKSI